MVSRPSSLVVLCLCGLTLGCPRDEWRFRPRQDAALDRPAPDAALDAVALDVPADLAQDATLEVGADRVDASIEGGFDAPDASLDRLDVEVVSDTTGDRAGDVAPDRVADVAGCPDGFALCDGGCTSTLADPRACMGCGVTCPPANALCAGGMCAPRGQASATRTGATSIVIHRVALDARGYVYALAHFTASVTFPGNVMFAPIGGGDWLLLSFTRAGAFRWGRRIGTDGDDLQAQAQGAVATDARGNVVVAVTVSGTNFVEYGDMPRQRVAGGVSDGFVASYDANGAARWGYVIGGALQDEVSSLAITADGTAYVTGALQGSPSLPAAAPLPAISTTNPFEAFVMAFSPDDIAAPVAAARFGGTGTISRGISIAAAPSGNVYLSCAISGSGTIAFGSTQFTSTPSDLTDGVLLRLTRRATVEWARRIGGNPSSDSIGPVVSGADDGVFYGATHNNVVVFPNSAMSARATVLSAGGDDAFVVRYSAVGDYITHHPVATTGVDVISALGRDAAGSINVAGRAQGFGFVGTTSVGPTGTRLDPFLMRLTTSTSEAAPVIRPPDLGATLELRGMSFDPYGAVALVGTASGASSPTWGMFGLGTLSPGTGMTTWLAIYPRP
jgi:hypothetical protein